MSRQQMSWRSWSDTTDPNIEVTLCTPLGPAALSRYLSTAYKVSNDFSLALCVFCLWSVNSPTLTKTVQCHLLSSHIQVSTAESRHFSSACNCPLHSPRYIAYQVSTAESRQFSSACDKCPLLSPGTQHTVFPVHSMLCGRSSRAL